MFSTNSGTYTTSCIHNESRASISLSLCWARSLSLSLSLPSSSSPGHEGSVSQLAPQISWGFQGALSLSLSLSRAWGRLTVPGLSLSLSLACLLARGLITALGDPWPEGRPLTAGICLFVRPLYGEGGECSPRRCVDPTPKPSPPLAHLTRVIHSFKSLGRAGIFVSLSFLSPGLG